MGVIISLVYGGVWLGLERVMWIVLRVFRSYRVEDVF